MAAWRMPFGEILPYGSWQNTAGGSYTNYALDDSNDAVAWIFNAPNGDTITHVGFRYGVRTGTPPTYIASLQGVNTSGDPDGTVKGGGSPASVTFTPPADATWDGTWQWVALANSYTMSPGEDLAINIVYSSGTVDGSNNSSFTYVLGDPASQLLAGNMYADLFATSWNKQSTRLPVFGFKSASAVYGCPIQSTSTSTTTTNGNRIALKFQLPSGITTTYKVTGFRFNGNPSAGGAFDTAAIWNGSGVLQSDVKDGRVVLSATIGRVWEFYFTEAASLAPGTDYYIGLQHGNTGNATNVITWNVAAAADLAAFPGGTAWILSTWNGSAWSDTTTARPLIEPILSDMTASAGGTNMHKLLGKVA